MKKTISTQLGNISFIMTIEAHDALTAYLEKIKKVIAPEDLEETMKDFELRIAELLTQKSLPDQVIEKDLIEEIITIIGHPENFQDQTDSTQFQYDVYNLPKKLFRDPDDAILGGVASGLSHYFSIHRVIVRLLFVAFTIYTQIGLFVYIILWILVPKARTYVEKIAMKGGEISPRYYERELNKIYRSKNFTYQNTSKYKFFDKLWDFIESLLIYTKDFIVKFVSRIIYIILFFTVIVLLSVLFLFVSGIYNNNLTTLQMNFNNEHLLDYLMLFFPSTSAVGTVAISILIFTISFLLLLISSYKLLINKDNAFFKRTLIIGIAVLVASGAFLVFYILSISKHYTYEASYILQSEYISESKNDTIYLIPINLFADEIPYLQIRNDSVYSSNIDVVLSKNPAQQCIMTVKAKAVGKNKAEAFKNIQQISYTAKFDKNKLILSSNFSFPRGVGFRNQKIILEISLPVNKIIFLPNNLSNLYYKNDEDKSQELSSGFYKMSNEGPIKL